MLGEAGSTVYCTGRSVRGDPSPIGRPETIEETAEQVDEAGGHGIAVRTDHSQLDQVEALFDAEAPLNLRETGALEISAAT